MRVLIYLLRNSQSPLIPDVCSILSPQLLADCPQQPLVLVLCSPDVPDEKAAVPPRAPTTTRMKKQTSERDSCSIDAEDDDQEEVGGGFVIIGVVVASCIMGPGA